jgi:hypothetical protein
MVVSLEESASELYELFAVRTVTVVPGNTVLLVVPTDSFDCSLDWTILRHSDTIVLPVVLEY